MNNVDDGKSRRWIRSKRVKTIIRNRKSPRKGEHDTDDIEAIDVNTIDEYFLNSILHKRNVQGDDNDNARQLRRKK